jgi:hypothetical protein
MNDDSIDWSDVECLDQLDALGFVSEPCTGTLGEVLARTADRSRHGIAPLPITDGKVTVGYDQMLRLWIRLGLAPPG